VLRLRRRPIDATAPLTVTLAGTAQSVWRDAADGDRLAADVLLHSTVPGSPWCPDALYRLSGWGGAGWSTVAGWSRCECGCGGGAGHISGDPQPIEVTYTGGFLCVPEDGTPNQLPHDLQRAVLETIRSWHRDQQQGTAEIVSLVQPGGGPTFEVPRWMPYGALQTFLTHRPVHVMP
jgi:hypothetical protein